MKIIQNHFPSFTNNSILNDSLCFLPCDDLISGTVCIRPGLEEKALHISVLKENSKTIFNNYGHKGNGWTFSYGSALESFNDFKTTFPNLPSETPITIIGSGVIGSFTFLILKRHGFTNITVVSEDWNKGPSWEAGAYLSPSIGASKQENQDIQKYGQVVVDTFEEAIRIIEGKSDFLNAYKGVKLIDIYYTTDSEDTVNSFTTINSIVEKGLLPPLEEVTVDFGGASRKMMKGKVVFFDTYWVMREFHGMMTGYAKCETRKVGNLKEIEDDIIFNCSGINGDYLGGNEKTKPVCGHVLKMRNGFFDGIITGKVKRLEGLRTFYYFPKSDGKLFKGIIGGTHLYNYDGKDNERNTKEFNEMYETALIFFGRKRKAKF